MLAAALFLTGYNLLDEHRAGTDAEHALEELLVRTPETTPSSEEGVINRSEMAATEIEGEDYIGILEIPSLEIVLPVMAEWSDSNLKIAPCRYHGSAYSGDLVIAGHNYRTHFGALWRQLPPAPGSGASCRKSARRIDHLHNVGGSTD